MMVDPLALYEEAVRVMHQAHRGTILDALPDDAARAAQCRAWASEARNKWFQGQAESVADMLVSKDRRYARMDAVMRRIIGQRKWGTSPIAKDLIGDEQACSTWARTFSLAAGEPR